MRTEDEWLQNDRTATVTTTAPSVSPIHFQLSGKNKRNFLIFYLGFICSLANWKVFSLVDIPGLLLWLDMVFHFGKTDKMAKHFRWLVDSVGSFKTVSSSHAMRLRGWEMHYFYLFNVWKLNKFSSRFRTALLCCCSFSVCFSVCDSAIHSIEFFCSPKYCDWMQLLSEREIYFRVTETAITIK